MHGFIFALLLCTSLVVAPFFVSAEEEYIGEDLWNDIYKRIDEWVYAIKKQLVENRLEGSGDSFNAWIGEVCSKKEGGKNLCFEPWVDFTASEFDDVTGGDMWPIYLHMNTENAGIDTELSVRIRGILMEHYTDIRKQVDSEQKKLHSVGSIGLFTDGNEDNSGYDLMTDLENIHNALFARDIPYDGTDNMGASSLRDFLDNSYDHPFSLSDAPDTTSAGGGSSASATLSWLTLSWILNNGSGCTTDQIPSNLDPGFLRDVQSELSWGKNFGSSVAFSDNGKLPEHWAKVAQGGSSGLAGGGSDSFPCSGKDFFCILISMTNYTQNILGGGKAATIEKILDENLTIANKFAPSSFAQAKMTKLFFGLSLKSLYLPDMIHIGVNVSRLPPPILNFKPGTTGGEENAWPFLSKGEEDEINQILVGTFEELWLDFKRQNSLERNHESRAVNNLTYLTSDVVNEKTDTSQTPMKSGYVRAKEMELKKGYGDSFHDDLFELHDFTLAFSKSLQTLTSVIKEMHAIPQK